MMRQGVKLKEPGHEERIRIVRQTRAAGAATLARAFSAPRDEMSELAIRDRWLAGMRDDPAILPDGWYEPPPGGASVLIGHPDKFERMEYASLRQPEVWARDDISFLDESLVYAYASPTDRSTGLIGDIGVTLYRGSNNSVREHLSTCLEISVKVAQFVQVGMELREAFHFAEKLISEARLTNQTSSVTDLGALNVGHTVPFTFDSYPNEARRCLADETAMGIADLISRQRVFINSSSSLRIQPNMAFTIEPRMASELMPLSSFHLIVAFLDGQKSVLSSFQPVFDVFGMVEYLPTDLLAALEEMSREDGGLVC